MSGEDFYRIKKYCLKVERVIGGNSVSLLADCSSFFREVFEIIEKAKKVILLEVYEFADDKFGRKIFEALKKKVGQKVKVYVIYDSIGSLFSEKGFFEEMINCGINVAEYNPARYFYNLRKFFTRDHRKIIVADFLNACIGGFNISLDYAPESMGGRQWKDCGVLLRGPVCGKISELFLQTWKKNKNKDIPLEKIKADSYGSSYVSVAEGSGMRNYFSIRRNYKYAIDAAVEEIFITNAYFLPDKIIYRRLIKAAMRGVSVKIIVPEKTDHPYVRLASWAILPKLIENGVEIYQWKGKILHSKTAVIDSFWVSLGSHNLDHRSLHYNLELNVNIYDQDIGRKMREIFLSDLKNCQPVTLQTCKNRNLVAKFLSHFFYFFRTWL